MIEKEIRDESMQQQEQEENNDEEIIHPSNEEDFFTNDVQEDEDLENGSINTSNTTEDFNEEEILEKFEKRVLYLLLTLQTVFYTSEAAIEFVATSLMELFLAISTTKLV
jgi:hypothetical protein